LSWLSPAVRTLRNQFALHGKPARLIGPKAYLPLASRAAFLRAVMGADVDGGADAEVAAPFLGVLVRFERWDGAASRRRRFGPAAALARRRARLRLPFSSPAFFRRFFSDTLPL
jgi:hypothetical protein